MSKNNNTPKPKKAVRTKAAPKPKPSRKTGRPTKYTKELADRICSEIAGGKSLRSVCVDPKMPDKATVFRWLRVDDVFRDQYARACEERSEALVEEVLDIADDASNDWMDIWNARTQEEERVIDREHIERSKVRIDTRKWIASKLKPKKYGDKLDVTSGGERVNPYAELTTAELRKLAQGK